MEEKERYELIGYCSYRDTETGVISDNFVGLLNQQYKEIIKLREENQQLKQQLAEKEKEETKRMEDFEKGCQEYYKSNQTEIAELKNQLSEKDELLKQKIGDMKSTDFIKMCVSCGFIVEAKEIDNQTAIAELIKVQKYISDNAVYLEEESFGREINDYIDQQIKELRG